MDIRVANITDEQLYQDIVSGVRSKPLTGINNFEKEEIKKAMLRFGCKMIPLKGSMGKKVYHPVQLALLQCLSNGYEYRKMCVVAARDESLVEVVTESVKVVEKDRNKKHFNKRLKVQK